ncbi:adenosine deaminase-like protein [Anaeramoeba ignava]|uniref:Adenosine deaminase-like protein n=1 Tax=Anaeramoeba ignava TaxID=1746090 RepID=A0A9Q0LIS1_ANAIG|nr:adenosine deaminase-like protein [Anaeramoeba ignava]
MNKNNNLTFQQILNKCKKIPKAELHAHLNGSIRESTIKEFIEKSNLKNKINPEDTKLLEKGSERTLSDCFKLFDLIYLLIDDLEKIKRITKEVIEDFYYDNCIYLELRTTPRFLKKSSENQEKATKKEHIETIISTIKETTKNLNNGIVVKLILSINRAYSKEIANETIEIISQINQKDVIIGIDFAGNPFKNKFIDFVPVLKKAKDLGLFITLHFAEKIDYEESIQMLKFNPQRLGHANYLNDEIRNLLFDSKIPVEICLTSNVKTESVPSFEKHHAKEFYKRNHPISFCTDDQGVFLTSLSKEFANVSFYLNFSIKELKEISKKSFNYAFAKDEALKKYQEFIEKKKINLK